MRSVALGLGFGFVVVLFLNICFKKDNFMCGDLPAICVCTMCMQCLRRPEKELHLALE